MRRKAIILLTVTWLMLGMVIAPGEPRMGGLGSGDLEVGHAVRQPHGHGTGPACGRHLFL